MKWDDLRALTVLAEKDTFTQAARALGLSVATLTRRIERLEMDLALPLVRRSPSGISLTPEGARILVLARQGGEYLGQIERMASAIRSGALRDPVRISSTEPVIANLLAPHAAAFLREHPDIQLDLTVSTEISNLQRHEADLAIRLSRPSEPDLMTRKLAEVEFGLYAAKSLVETRTSAGRKEPDWRTLPFIGFNDDFGEIPERGWLDRQGVRDRVCLMSSSTRAQLRAVRSGAGAAILPTYTVRDDPELVAFDVPTIPNRQLWLVFHRDARTQPTLLRVRDWIMASCQATLTGTSQI